MLGTWYLPAICELGGPGEGESCSSGLANIDTNLVQLGFGGLNGGLYWSSTEYSASPVNIAWAQYFAAGGGSIQEGLTKNIPTATRCARAMTY